MLHFSNKIPSVDVVEKNNHHAIKAYWGQGSADQNPQNLYFGNPEHHKTKRLNPLQLIVLPLMFPHMTI
jgi:hypothetical protein